MMNLTDGSAAERSSDPASDPTQFVGKLTTELEDRYPIGGGESIRRRDGSRTIASTLRLSRGNLALNYAIRETPTVQIEPNYRTTDGGSRLLIFTAVTERSDVFESALERDHTVADVMAVDYEAGTPVYRVRLTDAAFPITPMLGQLGVTIREMIGTGFGWRLRAQFPSRGAFATFRRFCAKNDVTFRVDNLSWGDDEVPERGVDLTASQWETLDVAYERGYFEVPRRTSQAELATELGISASAVSQRIRRGVSKLLEAQLRSGEN